MPPFSADLAFTFASVQMETQERQDFGSVSEQAPSRRWFLALTAVGGEGGSCFFKCRIMTGNFRRDLHLLVSDTTGDNKWEETSSGTATGFKKRIKDHIGTREI